VSIKTLETERLVLRGWRLDDVDDLYEYAKKPSMAMGGWEPHANKSISLRALREFIEEDDRWAVALKTSGKAIGQVRLYPDENRGRFSERNSAYLINYALSEDYWGKGYMTEAVKRVVVYAFEELKIELLGVFTSHHNVRSKRVIERCGFQYEGANEHSAMYSILRRK